MDISFFLLFSECFGFEIIRTVRTSGALSEQEISERVSKHLTSKYCVCMLGLKTVQTKTETENSKPKPNPTFVSDALAVVFIFPTSTWKNSLNLNG